MYSDCESVDLHRFPYEPWGRAELFKAFDRIKALHNTIHKRFCLFIDGLDEYEGEHSELVELLSSFAASPNIKLCLSSRP